MLKDIEIAYKLVEDEIGAVRPVLVCRKTFKEGDNPATQTDWEEVKALEPSPIIQAVN